MTNLKERHLERLNTKLNTLQNELCKENTSLESFEELVKEIKTLETEKKYIEKKALLKKVNDQQTKERNLLIEVLKINFPPEDITTESGQFHATKVKKIDVLNNLCKDGHVYAEYKTDSNGKGIYEAITISGQRIRLVNYTYEGTKSFMNYFKNLKEALHMNGIKEKPVTFSEFKKAERVALKESEKIKKAIEIMEKKLKDVDIYFFEYNDLLKRFSERGIYTYS